MGLILLYIHTQVGLGERVLFVFYVLNIQVHNSYVSKFTLCYRPPILRTQSYNLATNPSIL